jgi:probable lipoprotein NlpC
MRTWLTTLLIPSSVLLIAACSSGPQYQAGQQVDFEHVQHLIAQSHSQSAQQQLTAFYQQWQGVPYQYGGNTQRGIDCSAFVQQGYQVLFQKQIPRTTKTQVEQGQKVAYKNRQYGDLVFFKTGFKVRHVGIYLADNQFLHASSKYGVTISRLDSPYYSDAFWQIRRL